MNPFAHRNLPRLLLQAREAVLGGDVVAGLVGGESFAVFARAQMKVAELERAAGDLEREAVLA